MVYFFTACVGMTMTMHRWLSHRSWNPPAWFQTLGLASATWGLMGSPIAWVALHREHHQHADQEKDPHSPLHHPWWKVHFLTMFQPAQGADTRDLLRMKFLVFIHRHYVAIHLAILLLLAAWGWKWLVCLYLAPAALTWHSGGIVVSLNHLFGYRNFATGDNSRNNLITGFVTFGEGWHNNHHAKPARASFSQHWWEIDLGGILIHLLGGKNVER
jgi:fatty-acid desaturase